jgi:hypothetical protein
MRQARKEGGRSLLGSFVGSVHHGPWAAKLIRDGRNLRNLRTRTSIFALVQ